MCVFVHEYIATQAPQKNSLSKIHLLGQSCLIWGPPIHFEEILISLKLCEIWHVYSSFFPLGEVEFIVFIRFARELVVSKKVNAAQSSKILMHLLEIIVKCIASNNGSIYQTVWQQRRKLLNLLMNTEVFFLKEIILSRCEKESHRQKEPFRQWEGRYNRELKCLIYLTKSKLAGAAAE